MRAIAIDPAGDWTKGKGVTGFIEVDINPEDFSYKLRSIGDIKAAKFDSRLDYWMAHAKILTKDVEYAIIEDYRLYNHSGAPAAMQTGSYLETSRLLGLLEYWCANNNIKIIWQMARDTQAYKENVLVARGILKKVKNRYYFPDGTSTNDHIRSALKHLHRRLAVWKSK